MTQQNKTLIKYLTISVFYSLSVVFLIYPAVLSSEYGYKTTLTPYCDAIKDFIPYYSIDYLVILSPVVIALLLIYLVRKNETSDDDKSTVTRKFIGFWLVLHLLLYFVLFHVVSFIACGGFNLISL